MAIGNGSQGASLSLYFPSGFAQLCRLQCRSSGNNLQRAKRCPFTGIAVSSNLSFSEHIKNIVEKAHQRANMIHRCFVSRNVNLLVRAFTVYTV